MKVRLFVQHPDTGPHWLGPYADSEELDVESLLNVADGALYVRVELVEE